MTSHLDKAASDITKAIPNADFSGLAVIDWEFWSPIWGENSDQYRVVYQTESIKLVRRRHPDWDSGMVETMAKLEFENAAKSLFEGVILLGRQLRPKGSWGFYHFPYCDNQKHVTYCSTTGMTLNNQLTWMFDATTAVYPSIYLHDKVVGMNGSVPFVNSVLGEAFRIRQMSRHPLSPIYSYCRFNYSHTSYYVNMVRVFIHNFLDKHDTE